MADSGDPRASIPRHDLLGVCVDAVTMDAALDTIEASARNGVGCHVITLDASMVVLASRDPELRRIIQEAGLITPDSSGVLWAARRQGIRLPERVSGVEIVARLAERSARSGVGLYFLGAAPGVAEEAADRLVRQWPGCRIVGFRDGYFAPEDEPRVVDAVRRAAPGVLCVGMGIPRQEKWIARWGGELGAPVMIGVGGTFDVLSGRVQRAPAWMQRQGLEWIHRLVRNPRKITKVMTLPRFVLMALSARRPEP
ncbi:MAG: WecB/TagA/CpsF family glycosyltransferase [Chthonomonadales bacterium]|nr:WecB/TagA/CpsF family glycosyltransferase [Chthonomonadales bacterium]